MFKVTAITFILNLIAGFACTQHVNNTAQRLKPVNYRQDLAFLKTAFENNYPSFYRFNDKEQVDKFFDSCDGAINDNTTDISFYATVKYILSFLEDGHLSASASPELMNIFQEKWNYFPLSIIFLADKAFNVCQDSLVPAGAEILSINKMAMREITAKLFKYIVGDGKITTGKNYVLNNGFWFYYNLIFGEREHFEVEYRLPEGKEKVVKLFAGKRNKSPCNNMEIPGTQNPLTLDFFPGNVALMTIKTFSHSELSVLKNDFGNFLDTSFDAINSRKVTKLILDLRGNGGGADVYGALLYSYLTDKPFRYYAELETKEKKLAISDHPNLGVQKPVDNNYKGQVFFLVDGLTFSAAAEFCTIASDNNRGIFVGEETGGGFCGNTSAQQYKITLPSSKISVYIPSTKYTMAVKNPALCNRGIIPDHIVIPTINDIIHRIDLQLGYTKQLAALN